MAKQNKGKGSAVVAAVVAGDLGVTPLVRQGERVYPADRRNGDKVGLVHGLLLTGWYNGVFDRLACGQAVVADDGSGLPVYSDEAIAAAVRAEYPGRANTSAANGGYQGTSAYRGYYNNQQHGLGAPGYMAPKPATVRKAKPAAVPAVPAAKAVPVATPAAKVPASK